MGAHEEGNPAPLAGGHGVNVVTRREEPQATATPHCGQGVNPHLPRLSGGEA